MSIEVTNLTKRFGTTAALENINLSVERGELIALLGPSGSGKTTLLRILAGLETHDSGTVWINGEDSTQVPVRKRQTGFVFQHYALFRHMNVFENIAFGIKVRPFWKRPKSSEIKEKVNRLLDLVQLSGFGKRLPSQLSGGQRQRVALARALAIDPKLLLLDEPFGALDARVRKDLRRWVRELHDQLHITTIFVTHDQDEALEIADRVVVMRNAQIEQIGTPQDVYDHPTSPFVAQFLGTVSEMNVENGTAYIRPHHVELAIHSNSEAQVEMIVREIHAAGPMARIDLERADTGEKIESALTRQALNELQLVSGQRVFAKIRESSVFPK
ncbi:MAG: sulfate ABC transporter ATP-binding protein [Chthoniobacterales bacterium]